MLETLWSGGQRGVDFGALVAAERWRVKTGGFAPQRWLVESADGRRHIPMPELGTRFGLVEFPTGGYPERRRANIEGSHATLVFLFVDSPGSLATIREANELGRPCKVVRHGAGVLPRSVAYWIASIGIRHLNVAGTRESKAPGIEKTIENYLGIVLQKLGHTRFDIRGRADGTQPAQLPDRGGDGRRRAEDAGCPAGTQPGGDQSAHHAGPQLRGDRQAVRGRAR